MERNNEAHQAEEHLSDQDIKVIKDTILAQSDVVNIARAEKEAAREKYEEERRKFLALERELPALVRRAMTPDEESDIYRNTPVDLSANDY